MPPGTYTYRGCIGHYPDFIDDDDEFTFVKLPGLDNNFTIAVSGNDLILSWPAVAYALQYKIYYQDLPYYTPSGTPQAVILPPDTTWTDVNALNQGQRFYRKVVEY